MLTNLIHGLTQLLTPGAVPYLLVGMCIGMFIAMLPGLGVGVALSLMLTLVYHMNVVAAVALMLGTLGGEYFSASITAILLNTPGAPESYPTTNDGFPMAERGEAGRALAISAACTWMGGWIACIVFVLLLQLAGSLITFFKPPEYMAIIILALVLVGLSGGRVRPSKVLVSAGFGLMLSFVGSDPVSGVDRFTGGLSILISGIDVIPLALGVFAVTQMVIMYGTGRSISSSKGPVAISNFGSQIRTGVKDVLTRPFDVARSALVAVLLGLIPGIGGFVANYISYGLGQRLSRARSKFGTGVPEGVISAEGSSLAKEVGSILPAVTLGLPSGVGMVLFIAALSILGIQPGFPLLKQYPALPYTMMWTLAIVGMLSCIIGLLLAPQTSKITRIRGPVLLPFICGLAALGSFSSIGDFAGTVEMLFFVLVGVLARKTGYSVAAMAVGLVLGGTFDDNTFTTFQSYGWSFLWRSPLATVLLVVVAGLIIAYSISSRRMARARGLVPERNWRKFSRPDGAWKLDIVMDALFLIAGAGYFAVALTYPKTAGIIPGITGAVVAFVSIVRLVIGVMKWPRSQELAHESAEPEVLGEAIPIQPPPVPAPSRSRLLPRGGVGVKVAEASVENDAASDEAVELASATEMRNRLRETLYPVSEAISRREAMAVAWAAIFVVAIFLFGFQIGVPLAALAYCVFGVRFEKRVFKYIYIVCTVGVLYVLASEFMSAFHLTFAGKII